MKIHKAVITAAGAGQRTLALQTLIDRDGQQKSILQILIEETLHAGIDEICLVIQPGDEDAYRSVAQEHAGRLVFAPQKEQLGHGHAVYCARDFLQGEPFLHLVGDHLYVSHGTRRCAQQLVELAAKEACTVSAVQATRESLLPYYGAIGARRVSGRSNVYEVERVIEKPTPTIAEQQLIVPGIRVGYYLCYFGMHVLTPSVLDILERLLHQARHAEEPSAANSRAIYVTLADALGELCRQEHYLAVEQDSTRYDVGVKYGLLQAQLALSINGQDREEVLAMLLSLLAQQELSLKTERT